MLEPAPAQAQRPKLDLVAGPHAQSASTEHGSPTFRYQVKASGTRDELKRFCRDQDSKPVGSLCPANQSSQPSETVKLEMDVEWESFDTYGRQRHSGYPVHTKTAIVSQAAVDSINMRVGDDWYWDRTVNGIPRNEERPMLATVTMTVIDTTKARAGSTTTHQLALNPQFVVTTQGVGATEGTDTHMTVHVALVPPALETFTVDYATNTNGSATAGTDFTATSGTLTFAAGESQKQIQIPIMDDTVNDSGETVVLIVSNPSPAARLTALGGTGTLSKRLEVIGIINNDEPGPDPSVDDLPLVTVESKSGSVTEGSDAVFELTRTGETDEALTVALTVTESGAMLSGAAPTSAAFAVGDAKTELRIETAGDSTVEDDSTVTVTLASGDTYRLGTNDQSKATATILDDDAPALPGGTVAVAGTTVWTADMTVTDYGNGNVGAGSADLLANQRGSAGLQGRWLYYNTNERKLRMAFTTGVESCALTVAAGNVKLKFPEGRSGDSSFTWNDVDVDWTDGQTFEARVVEGHQEATEAPDPPLKALTVSDATLSPAFDPEKVAYTATVGADTTTLR